jgi:hypothetical protein
MFRATIVSGRIRNDSGYAQMSDTGEAPAVSSAARAT